MKPNRDKKFNFTLYELVLKTAVREESQVLFIAGRLLLLLLLL